VPRSDSTHLDTKQETQKQWDADPCGATTAGELETGSREFFEKIEAERYGPYAPWLPEAMAFDSAGGLRVLEIGPGLGTDHARFARAGARLFCLDLTRRHLALTLRRFGIDGLQTRATWGDAETLPFQDASFDLVYSFGVLHHTPDTAGALRETHRVLKPGGRAIITLYHRHSLFYWWHTILFRGVIQAGLRRGYRQLLSEIEYRSPESKAVPLVKVFSRSECRTLFSSFSRVCLRTDHIDVNHAIPFVPSSSPRVRRLLERIGRRWGWYVTVFAGK